jgi:hypothetical protein
MRYALLESGEHGHALPQPKHWLGVGFHSLSPKLSGLTPLSVRKGLRLATRHFFRKCTSGEMAAT